MDRCALFVDAGYALADGGMAVHGTRRRESVSWDYEGLLHLFASLATERSGLPLLRCYWYEATVEGRRSADHDALADLPGVKLRLAKMRPGRREGVESEIHRDLETLARNKAVSDAVVVSADEDLAEVVAGVQDLGMRVTLLHIAVDGDWSISRALRQECDDIIEISSELLRPYAELISGAEPVHPDDRDGAPLITLRPAVNGHGQAARQTVVPGAWARLPTGSENGHQPPGYEEAVPPAPAAAVQDVGQGPREPLAAPADMTPPAAEAAAAPADAVAVQAEAVQARQEAVPAHQEAVPIRPEAVPFRPEMAPVVQKMPARQDQQPVWHDHAAPAPEPQPVQELYPAPVAMPAPVALPAPAEEHPVDHLAARAWPPADLSGYNPGATREQLPRDPVMREPLPREPLADDAGDGLQPVPVAPGSAQIRRLPTRGPGFPAQPPQVPGQQGGQPGGQPTAAQPALSAPVALSPGMGQPGMGQPSFGQPMAPGAGYAPIPNGSHNGSYSGPQPVIPPGSPAPAGQGNPAGLAGAPVPPGAYPGNPGVPGIPTPVPPLAAVGQPSLPGPVYTPAPGLGPVGSQAGPGAPSGPMGAVGYPGGQPSVSLAEAVQSAHDEGQEFGSSVARDAPALWLEAVLARKPRMPSDLEARLLQGSALPIDFLLHDEVRHALRRGFWDALERARR